MRFVKDVDTCQIGTQIEVLATVSSVVSWPAVDGIVVGGKPFGIDREIEWVARKFEIYASCVRMIGFPIDYRREKLLLRCHPQTYIRDASHHHHAENTTPI